VARAQPYWPRAKSPREPRPCLKTSFGRLLGLFERFFAGFTRRIAWESNRERVGRSDGLLALDRMERAVEKVRDRLLRSTAALEAAGVPYAVIGGNAVMAWVEQADEAAVRMKLTSNRDQDRMHLRDMLGVGLIDATWPARYPPELAARLQHLIDTPDG